MSGVTVMSDKELEALMTLRESARRCLGYRALNNNPIQYERKKWFYQQMGLIDEKEAESVLESILSEGMGLALMVFSPLDRLLLSREEDRESKRR
jgi:hypothetical protein